MQKNSLPSHVCHLQGNTSGPRVVIFGGTHGDETTGVEVIQAILKALNLPVETPSGSHQIEGISGDLYLAIGNPLAVEKGRRSVSGIRDLNRCFHETFFDDPIQMQLVDQQRAAELKELLASADFFFDLHSVSTEETIPFVGLTTFTDRHADICSQIPVEYVVNVHAILGDDVGNKVINIEQTPTTCSWVNRHGGVGLCYEMGYQKDFTSVSRTLAVLMNLLKHVGSISSLFAEQMGVDLNEYTFYAENQRIYKLIHCERNQFKEFQYADPRFKKSFTAVKKGELIGIYEDGEHVDASFDGLIVFPAGEHTLSYNPSLFYLAVPEKS